MTDTENNIVIQKKGLNRNIIDKYYTKINIVEQCIEACKENINIFVQENYSNSNLINLFVESHLTAFL